MKVSNKNWIPPEKWKKTSRNEKKAHYDKVKTRRNANNSDNNSSGTDSGLPKQYSSANNASQTMTVKEKELYELSQSNVNVLQSNAESLTPHQVQFMNMLRSINVMRSIGYANMTSEGIATSRRNNKISCPCLPSVQSGKLRNKVYNKLSQELTNDENNASSTDDNGHSYLQLTLRNNRMSNKWRTTRYGKLTKKTGEKSTPAIKPSNRRVLGKNTIIKFSKLRMK